MRFNGLVTRELWFSTLRAETVLDNDSVRCEFAFFR